MALDPIITEARHKARQVLLVNHYQAKFNLDLLNARVSDSGDLLTEDHPDVAESKQKHMQTEQLVSSVDISKETVELAQRAWQAELYQLLQEWLRLRAIHVDMRDNPDEYGCVMLDGSSPILPSEQTEIIKGYDAAIAAARQALDA